MADEVLIFTYRGNPVRTIGAIQTNLKVVAPFTGTLIQRRIRYTGVENFSGTWTLDDKVEGALIGTTTTIDGADLEPETTLAQAVNERDVIEPFFTAVGLGSITAPIYIAYVFRPTPTTSLEAADMIRVTKAGGTPASLTGASLRTSVGGGGGGMGEEGPPGEDGAPGPPGAAGAAGAAGAQGATGPSGTQGFWLAEDGVDGESLMIPGAQGPQGNAGADGSGGIAWTEVTGTSQAAAVDSGYIANNAALVTVTLPDTAALGSIVAVQGLGAGGWKIAQNASEQVIWTVGGVDGVNETTVGTGGYLASTDPYDAIELICLVANTTWGVRSAKGTIQII